MIIRKRTAGAAVLIGSAISLSPAQAAFLFLVMIEQDGANVVVTGSGNN